MSVVKYVLEAQGARAMPLSLDLVEGLALAPLSVGFHGTWMLDAPGVMSQHGYLYFDGATLFAQSTDPTTPLLIGDRAVPVEWTAISPPCAFAIGEASVVFRLATASDVAPDAVIEEAPDTERGTPPELSNARSPDSAVTRIAQTTTLLMTGRPKGIVPPPPAPKAPPPPPVRPAAGVSPFATTTMVHPSPPPFARPPLAPRAPAPSPVPPRAPSPVPLPFPTAERTVVSPTPARAVEAAPPPWPPKSPEPPKAVARDSGGFVPPRIDREAVQAAMPPLPSSAALRRQEVTTKIRADASWWARAPLPRKLLVILLPIAACAAVASLVKDVPQPARTKPVPVHVSSK